MSQQRLQRALTKAERKIYTRREKERSVGRCVRVLGGGGGGKHTHTRTHTRARTHTQTEREAELLLLVMTQEVTVYGCEDIMPLFKLRAQPRRLQ